MNDACEASGDSNIMLQSFSAKASPANQVQALVEEGGEDDEPSPTLQQCVSDKMEDAQKACSDPPSCDLPGCVSEIEEAVKKLDGSCYVVASSFVQSCKS